MAQYDMTMGANSTFGGGGLGGLGGVGMNALQGYWQGVSLEEMLRKLNNQRLLDQYRIPAEAALYDAHRYKNSLDAYLGQHQLAKTPATLAQRDNPFMLPQMAPQPAQSRFVDGFVDGQPLAPMGLNGYDTRETYDSVYGTPWASLRPLY